MDMRYAQPGTNPASNTPRKKRQAIKPPLECTKPLAHARDAPEEGKYGDPCRRGELAEEDVAGDLEDVRHEEDLEGDVEFVAGRVELLEDTEDADVTQVDTAHEAKHRKDPQEKNKVEADIAEHAAL